MTYERDTIRRIREAVANGQLANTFRATDVNLALGIDFASTFLPKHRVGNPGGNTELFVQASRGLYRLK
jgi:archaeosine-15-forming tRNA-guanine transglycosylase